LFSNREEENRDFCESYKSQILASDEREEASLFTNLIKVFFILFLLVFIAGVAFYGYHNFMNSKTSNDIKLPPRSVQISDDDLMVTLEEPKEKPIKETLVEEKAIENIADEVKMEIAKTELQEELTQSKELTQSAKETSETTIKEKHLEVPTSSPEAQYLEELAKLSDAIDKDRQ